MTKELWINLPVKNLAKSKEFFTKLGFAFNLLHSKDGFAVGNKKIVVMLFEEPTFKHFTRHDVSDTKKGLEVLFSIDAESRQEVDEMTNKARNAGGKVFAEPGENQGWMYGSGFADLDGHRWNLLFMDMSKMPKGK